MKEHLLLKGWAVNAIRCGYKLLIVAALIVALAGMHLSRAQNRESAAGSRPTPTASLEDQLINLGEQYDVYLTVETAYQEKEPRNWLEQYSVRRFSKGKGIHRELERLTETVPYFTYTYDSNPKVIHIKDARLAHSPGTPLET